MAQINLKDLSVTLGEPLFANLTLELRGGDRVGLVAANGRDAHTVAGPGDGGACFALPPAAFQHDVKPAHHSTLCPLLLFAPMA